jgi:nucleotide sugar dehydrogenase
MSISTSLIDSNEYRLPLDDSDENIDAFLAKNKNRTIVLVQGLGFVGTAMAIAVANAGDEYAVIGIDLPTESSYWKIGSINAGKLPLISSDDKLTAAFSDCISKGNLFATHSSYAYSLADIIVVDINLDVVKKGLIGSDEFSFDVPLEGFKDGIKQIALNCKSDALILVETTVPPGTCQKIVKPILDDGFAKRGLVPNYALAHSYERVMPGPNYLDSIINFYRVYAGVDDTSADRAELFLRTVISTEQYPLTRLASTTATETAKVLENTFRAMNIAFIQEWTEFAEDAGINLYEIIDAIRMRPTHKNIMRPGLGVGGYCLTKDPLLASWASKNFYSNTLLPQSEKAVQINDNMPLHTLKSIKKEFHNNLKSKNVLLLGVSYLNDVGDTRFTPVDLLYDGLIESGATVRLHDPFVGHWQEKNKEVDQALDKSSYDIIVICTGHKVFQGTPYINYINTISPVVVFDTMNHLEKQRQMLNKDIKIVVIGNGEI